MSYTTIYRTSKQNRVLLIKGIFEQNNIEYRIIKESNPADFPAEIKIQVKEKDSSKSLALLKENGFLSSGTGENSVTMAKFWLWLVIALITLIVASVLINSFWR